MAVVWDADQGSSMSRSLRSGVVRCSHSVSFSLSHLHIIYFPISCVCVCVCVCVCMYVCMYVCMCVCVCMCVISLIMLKQPTYLLKRSCEARMKGCVRMYVCLFVWYDTLLSIFIDRFLYRLIHVSYVILCPHLIIHICAFIYLNVKVAII